MKPRDLFGLRETHLKCPYGSAVSSIATETQELLLTHVLGTTTSRAW